MSKKIFPLILIASIAVNAVLAVVIYQKIIPKPQVISSVKPVVVQQQDFEEINPGGGYEINVTYGDLGPKMLASGVIDINKFKPTGYEDILTKGSNKKIRITTDNAYFLLNFFWAVGLNNKSKILTSGDMVKYGGEKDLGNFASTGGWTLGRDGAMNYYSKANLITLTPQQEGLVQTVAANIYRPCCNNPTSFPDCNHGMALLGVLELMAANGASDDQMFEAAKYFNAFWFPGNYYDLAVYFKDNKGLDFKDVDARLLLSKDYSSATGYQKYKSKTPQSGRGCGT